MKFHNLHHTSAQCGGDSYHTKKSMNIRPSQLKGSKPNKAILSSFSWKEPYARSTGRHLHRSRAGPERGAIQPAEMGKSDFKEKWPYMLCWHEKTRWQFRHTQTKRWWRWRNSLRSFKRKPPNYTHFPIFFSVSKNEIDLEENTKRSSSIGQILGGFRNNLTIDYWMSLWFQT